ncbi:MAG: biosynthetic-type acetolactate synthase large subunit [Armatimonadota bacterium]|nr:biosynthetic-type acetolactate synthase large subunit [Armatimonadota bacterium]MDR7450450.1 biosynthetic-type acetolactate synthase large subunit [Armatimonadota bacterium]MDR7466967.1 biosynthetic-type acetolactate synthase large subunit [Armatimonadota bacterium]MDR7493491.1 biosynthetic-type acetolactate synthase large subunit [Armatimonadota bacterium]MDR7498756.1 biosynthetic-type acetolactate synthase large subunit [Armatimonadota bacterium]
MARQIEAAPGRRALRARTMTGAQILVEALRREGVEIIFGHPGGASLPIYDALYDAKDIRHILVRHEQVAAHAAVGYARASGRVGVCTATSGPGATNLVTGITDAMMDSIPIVAITGQVPRPVIGNDAFQEADVTGVTMPITKWNHLVLEVGDVAPSVQRAFYLARTGRPGPVLVDLPRDVLQESAVPAFLDGIPVPGYRPVLDGNPRQIAAAAELLATATRPVIYAGGGVISAGASAELTALAERTGIPVTLTLMGKGAMDETHPLCLGMLGMHGSVYANYAVHEADVILAVGVRFDDRVTGRLRDFAPRARFIHIDIDPAEIGKNKPAHIPIVGDASRVLAALASQVRAPQIDGWWAQINTWRRRYPFRYRQGEATVSAQYVCDQLNRITGGEAVVTTDVGQHQMWMAQWYRPRGPRRFISSGGLGVMGFGFPAALGAKFACPESLVVAVVGDGGFQMTMQDLSTAVEYRMALPIIVLNNGALGMVRQWQTFFYRDRRSASILRNPDFARVAEAFGARGIRVERPEQVEPALRSALAVEDGPVVVDIRCDPEENCLPMIPSGQSVAEMIIDE